MNLLEALDWRYAVKQFSDEKIPAEDLRTLLEATRMSASSYGLQPYSIMVVTSEIIRRELLPYAYGQGKVLHSSHLIVFASHTDIGDVTVDRYIEKQGQVTGKSPAELKGFSEHMKTALAGMSASERQAWAHQQAYIALGTFLTSAALMRIDSCPMTGFEVEGFDRVLQLREQDMTATAICPIGRRHKGDVQAGVPKVRFDFDDLVLEV